MSNILNTANMWVSQVMQKGGKVRGHLVDR